MDATSKAVARRSPCSRQVAGTSPASPGPSQCPRKVADHLPIDIIVIPDDDSPMRYPGGKGKTYQHVINLMPPHRVYIETHLGGGAVMRHKLPATRNIAIDLSERAIELAKSNLCHAEFVCDRAEKFLSEYPFVGDELVYVDPPYHPLTRRRARVYQHDYGEEDHVQLLSILKTLPCMVILSGYENSLYASELKGWRTREFEAKTHTDVRTETLWFNFEPPTALHDSRHLGASFRERQTAKRRIERLKCKLRQMDAVERAAIAQWLFESFPTIEQRLSQ